MTVLIPSIINVRWGEALDEPTLFQWRSVTELCAIWYAQEYASNGPTELADDLATLANIAYQHYQDMMPRLEFEVAA